MHIAGKPDIVFAVNAADAEIDTAPVKDLSIAPREVQPGETCTAGRGAAAALARGAGARGAPRRVRLLATTKGCQPSSMARRVGRAVVVVLLLVGVFSDFAFDRPANRVATMFLIDASDSMGAVGKDDAVEWVRDALEAPTRRTRSRAWRCSAATHVSI